MTWAVETSVSAEPPSFGIQAKQQHTGIIAWASSVTPATVADGLAAPADFVQPLLVRSADCMPVVLLTERAASALHVSRKSLPAGLLENVPNFIDVAEITKVYIGPHICPKHFIFERRGEEIESFCRAYSEACAETPAGTSLSLRAAVDRYLEQWGVAENHIIRDGRCTFESAELPSYRRSLAQQERLAGNIYTIVRRA